MNLYQFIEFIEFISPIKWIGWEATKKFINGGAIIRHLPSPSSFMAVGSFFLIGKRFTPLPFLMALQLRFFFCGFP